jgi:hypothetical protein
MTDKLKSGDKVKFQIRITDFQEDCLTNDVDSNGCTCPVIDKELEGVILDFDIDGCAIVKFLNPEINTTELRVFSLSQIEKI